MSTLFDAQTRAAMHARIDRLEATRAGMWGKMDAPQMVCHAADQLRVALGDIRTRERRNFLRFKPLRTLLVYWLPWPKGKVPTVREMQTSQPAAWEGDLALLHGLVDRFADRRPDEPWAPHPAFGLIGGREWGRLCHKHLDHHLRQFAV
ncbi:MAG TPA: DUF1569 domain-containing protein [Thermoanaerobaculia bacterium]|nr:DUF1569 domain-containing protein [Thermoanaerobaculia bacterium]